MNGMDYLLIITDFSLPAVFLWHVTFVYLIVLMFLSFIIYKNSKDRIFFTYFVYVSLLFSYVLCRSYYFDNLRGHLYIYLYSYFIQVLYLCVYFHFGLSVLNFKKHFPNLTKWVYRYLYIASGIGLITSLAVLFELIPYFYIKTYFLSIFFPTHVSIALLILYNSLLLKQEKQRIYFIIGSIFYLVFGLAAILTSYYKVRDMIITQVSFFYLAIIIECTFFAIGLGIRVRDMAVAKLVTERKLNATQKELQKKILQQLKQQKEDNLALRKEKEVQTLATQIALLENKVLRSQMNSHFIFNVLNSIKAYIIEQNVPKAVTYLNKFSKLMRQVLEASRSEIYTLSDEIKAIKLYVDIEKMRVSDSLDSNIDIDIQQKTGDIAFPPLLMQPFVENAIWHGLMPSAGEKTLSIRVFNDGTDIMIEILDNGVGYSNSLSKKIDSKTHHSHGMSITKERIDQFNNKHNNKLSFGIKDRLDGVGTKVWIRITLS